MLERGSGLSNRLLDWYRPRVGHAYLLDFLAAPRQEGNTTIIQADLEKDIPLADASVDLVTSASSIEHLSAKGQSRFMFEAQRLLRPGGVLVMTVSYVLGLNERALEIFSRDPALAGSGCNISTRLDIRRLLEAAPELRCPVEPEWSRFPGFEGFSEDGRSQQSRDYIRSDSYYGDVRRLAERTRSPPVGRNWDVPCEAVSGSSSCLCPPECVSSSSRVRLPELGFGEPLFMAIAGTASTSCGRGRLRGPVRRCGRSRQASRAEGYEVVEAIVLVVIAIAGREFGGF